MNNLLSKLNNPFWFRTYLFLKLPLAFWAGLKIVTLSHTQSIVSVRYSFLSKNPFGSIYFACLSMAAEMSTGLPALLAAYSQKPAASMLVVGLKAEFYKKAVGKILFSCQNTAEIYTAAQEALDTKQPTTATAIAVGTSQDGTVVAKFEITWSFKHRNA